MEKRYLTPEDQELLDPLGRLRLFIASFPKNSETFEAPSKFYKKTPDEVLLDLNKIVDRFRVAKHTPYYNYWDELKSKYGPQGGKFAWQEVESICLEYYQRASNSRSINALLKAGRDYLLRRIREAISRYGYPQIPQQIKYLDTAAGEPTGLHKGDYFAETVQAKPWRHAHDAVPGERRMRNGNRVIFQDSVLNVRYVEKELSAVRYWLREHFPEYFDTWLNPTESLTVRLTRCVDANCNFVETDYKKMDRGFSWEVVQELILPLYEALLPDGFLSFSSMIEELFHNDLYMGDYVLSGLHNLFSGVEFTNDFETIYTVELAIGVSLFYQITDEIDIFALGDDCSIALPNYTRGLARKFMSKMIEVSNEADMIIHDDEKSRIGRGETRFCRKVYYPSGKRKNGILLGAYPSILAANNIIQPERPAKSEGISALADLQRLDGIYGVPEYYDVIQYFRKISSHKFFWSEEDQFQFSKRVDWWERVYGERWDPTSSVTFNEFVRLNLV